MKRVREESSSPKRSELCAFSMYLSESSPTDEDELRCIDAVRAKRELRSEISIESSPTDADEFRDINPEELCDVRTIIH